MVIGLTLIALTVVVR
ncbi:hypothetical protein [Pantoea deleyi]